MEAFYFSSPPLFGVYHAARSFDSATLVVICPPMMDEYRRSYRAFSDFAQACSQTGHHVMRFDYRGTGDSHSDLQDVKDVRVWVEDLDLAIEEGLALSGAEKVILVGARFGANIALLSAHPAVSKRICWDSLASGRAYLDWLANVDNFVLEEHREAAKYTNTAFKLDDCVQFAISESLKASIEALDETAFRSPDLLLTTLSKPAERLPGCAPVKVEFDYNWPEYEDGVISPAPVFTYILDKLNDWV